MVHHREDVLVVGESGIGERRGTVASEVETHIPEARWDLGELMAPHPSIGDAGVDEDDRPALPDLSYAMRASPDGAKPSGESGIWPPYRSIGLRADPTVLPELPSVPRPVLSTSQLQYLGPRPSVPSGSMGLSRQRRSLLASPLS